MAPVDGSDTPDAVVAVDSMSIAEPLVRTDMAADSTLVAAADSVPSPIGVKRIFNPDPNRALWLSVLCPGLGQIYNRRYWKVPNKKIRDFINDKKFIESLFIYELKFYI